MEATDDNEWCVEECWNSKEGAGGIFVFAKEAEGNMPFRFP
jgi:hypothetical protein